MMYAEALRAGMSAEAFWASSPRAVFLVARYRQRQSGAAAPRKPGQGRQAQSGLPRVRLNRLPHP